MKKINIIFVIFFSLLFSNQSLSEKHNQVSIELDRIKNDIIDLQKFVYKNDDSLHSNNFDSSEKNNLEELKTLINDIEIALAELKSEVYSDTNAYRISSDSDKTTSYRDLNDEEALCD